jgi:hypothetical protein
MNFPLISVTYSNLLLPLARPTNKSLDNNDCHKTSTEIPSLGVLLMVVEKAVLGAAPESPISVQIG